MSKNWSIPQLGVTATAELTPGARGEFWKVNFQTPAEARCLEISRSCQPLGLKEYGNRYGDLVFIYKTPNGDFSVIIVMSGREIERLGLNK